MTEHVLTPKDIEERIPHRYQNQLLDAVRFEEVGNIDKGMLEVCIQENDDRERMVFTKRIDNGPPVVAVPYMMEILALCSSVGACYSEPRGVLFVSIFAFSRTGYMRVGSDISGFYRKTRVKKDFLTCYAELNHDAFTLCEGTMMAYFPKEVPYTSIDSAEIEPPLSADRSIEKSHYNKSSEMVFVDSCISSDSDECVYQYTYPSTHPFVNGHFPNAPIMMGVTQWMMIEDALYDYVFLNGSIDPEVKTLSGDCKIKKLNGDVVCDVRSFCVSVQHNSDRLLNSVDLLSTEKVMFKGMVHPGETIVATITRLSV